MATGGSGTLRRLEPNSIDLYLFFRPIPILFRRAPPGRRALPSKNRKGGQSPHCLDLGSRDLITPQIWVG
jgi:hypothetical protein